MPCRAVSWPPRRGPGLQLAPRGRPSVHSSPPRGALILAKVPATTTLRSRLPCRSWRATPCRKLSLEELEAAPHINHGDGDDRARIHLDLQLREITGPERNVIAQPAEQIVGCSSLS